MEYGVEEVDARPQEHIRAAHERSMTPDKALEQETRERRSDGHGQHALEARGNGHDQKREERQLLFSRLRSIDFERDAFQGTGDHSEQAVCLHLCSHSLDHPGVDEGSVEEQLVYSGAAAYRRLIEESPAEDRAKESREQGDKAAARVKQRNKAEIDVGHDKENRCFCESPDKRKNDRRGACAVTPDAQVEVQRIRFAGHIGFLCSCCGLTGKDDQLMLYPQVESLKSKPAPSVFPRARARHALFGRALVFNQSWEDPVIDAQALDIVPTDSVLAVSGAGDNVLSLALAGPQKIDAVDLNPAQVYVLRLKIAAAQTLDYADFYHLFCLAPAPRARAIYSTFRHRLDPETRHYWDGHVQWIERGLYRAGHFGYAVAALRAYLQLVCGTRTLEQFFECSSLAEQREFYLKRIGPRWWNPLARPFAALTPVLWLFGARRNQLKRIRGHNFANFLETGIARVLTTLPARENYFWQQVFLGRYLVLPPYLQPENFVRLEHVVSRVETRVCRLDEILCALPENSVTCFNLLDAPDWLSTDETIECWKLLERAAAPGARVLFRSIDSSYRLPDSISAHWQGGANPDWLARERTGVYAGVYLYRQGGEAV